MIKESVKKLGFINTTEGYSYLVLLFIAMPLKYILGISIAVKIAGMIHGILFVTFVLLLMQSWIEKKWTLKENILFFVATLVPFGTFYTRDKIKSYE